MRGSNKKQLVLQTLLGLLVMASCKTALASTPSKASRKVLRGLKTQTQKESKQANNKSPKKQQQQPAAPEPKKTGGAAKNKKLYTEYNYFVEACQEELLADVINGGTIQHRQYTDFVYGYCRDSELEGKQCTKDQQERGFDYLPNELKLMYIKSFCPEDIEGQVECLHGMNERGRQYEVHDELEKLCGDLEKSMVKNDLLEKPDKKEEEEVAADVADTPTEIADKPADTDITTDADTDTDTGDAMDDYQDVFDPIEDGYTVIGGGVTEYADDATPSPVSSTPTSRPTAQPTSRPTKEPKAQTTAGGTNPWGGAPTGPWGESASMSSPTDTTADDSSPAAAPAATPESNTTPRPTMRPTRNQPGLAVNTFDNNADSDSDNDGMGAGGITAIVLIALLGITIASLSVLLIRRRRLRQQNRADSGITRQVFFLCTKLFNTSHKKEGGNDDHTYDDTYDRDETYKDSFAEHNGSIASEEIDFNNNGPLFESWPNVTKPRSQDGLLSDEEQSNHVPSSTDPSTYKSSLLHSFFSKSADHQRHEEDGAMTPMENAVDEIKRAISDAQWQDVYYLASKMASEGNIDSNENLQSALVRTNVVGGDYKTRPAPTRHHLKPEDVTKAAQLDVSLLGGDWITLAARAAVFAALENANNPVPASISFAPGKENADECLTKARAALEEAEKAAKERQEKLRQQQQQPSVLEESESEIEESVEERVVFINADEVSIDCESDGFEYPLDDYSDFSKSKPKEQSRGEESECQVSIDEDAPSKAADATNDGEQEDSKDDQNEDEKDAVSTNTRNDIPGPPSIALSNQSTIPTEASTTGEVPFASIAETARGPFRRDFENDISHPMEQEFLPEVRGATQGEVLK